MNCSIITGGHESLLQIDSRLLQIYGLRIEKFDFDDFFIEMENERKKYGTETHQNIFNERYWILRLGQKRDISSNYHGYRILIHNAAITSKDYPLRLEEFSHAVQLVYGIALFYKYHIKIEEINDENRSGLSFGENPFRPMIIEESILTKNYENDSFIDQFIAHRGNFDHHEYLKLSYQLYSSAFRLLKDRVPSYLILMSSMETLFNENPNQIAHTISRHVSLLISKDKDEFKKNYTEMKELYKHRNEVIHGIKPPHTIINETVHKKLICYLRQCIIIILSKNLDKKSLFTHLNVTGFAH